MPITTENVIETYRGDGKLDGDRDTTWERAAPLVVKDCPRSSKYVRLSIGTTIIDVLANDLVAAINNATNTNTGGF